MSIIKLNKIWFTFSAILIILSIVSIGVWKLNLGIDFTGGSLLEIEFMQGRPSSESISENIGQSGVETNVKIQKAGDKGFLIRMKTLSENEHQQIVSAIKDKHEIDEKRFESVGPVIGQELREKALWAIVIVLLAIVIYIAWAFRTVSRPVASWKYGIIALVALFHDIIITVGIFAVLGNYLGIEIGLPFVAALLTILGYSVNDTIVVFDRVRENLKKHSDAQDFAQTIDMSIRQTVTRSLNTSLTTLFVLFAIYIFGGTSIRDFILTLIIGIALGTYSSIFIASPLLSVAEKMRLKKV
jgi:preprotein translocase subunit SecF